MGGDNKAQLISKRC